MEKSRIKKRMHLRTIGTGGMKAVIMVITALERVTVDMLIHIINRTILIIQKLIVLIPYGKNIITDVKDVEPI